MKHRNVGGLSFEIARSMRDVLLGAEVPVSLTRWSGPLPSCGGEPQRLV